jgi:hypothetical protein
VERNRLNNGRFQNDLNNWTAVNAAYSPGDGDDHYGVAVLETGGGYIEQTFSLPSFRSYTLALSVKAVGASLTAGQATLRVTDGDGYTVTTQNLTGTADTWTDNTFTLGLAPGTTYTLRLTNVSAVGQLKIDDVWLWWCPVTRAGLATRAHAKLARLATQRSLSTTPAGALTEGSYTYAIDAGLRQAGAINPETDLPDIRYLESAGVDTVLNLVESEMLEQLQRDYAVEVDITVGPRSESFSQVAGQIGQLTGGPGGGGGRVVMRKLGHEGIE